MSDEIIDTLIDAIHEAYNNGEGELYPRYVKDALQRAGLLVIEAPK